MAAWLGASFVAGAAACAPPARDANAPAPAPATSVAAAGSSSESTTSVAAAGSSSASAPGAVAQAELSTASPTALAAATATVAVAGPVTAAVALSPNPPPVDVDPAAALGLQPDEGEIVVHTDVLRGHPVGAQLGPILGTWPGWRATLHALARDPIADLDWFDVVGPSDAARGRLLARTSSSAADAALDGRLVALQARSAEPSASHVEAGLPAAAARLDGTLRVVFRPQARLAAATPASQGMAISRGLAHDRVRPPASVPLEAVRADVPHPHDGVRAVPASIRRMRASVLALANGDADASAVGECASADDAKRAAASLVETVSQQNSPLVRMLTHGLLDTIVIAADAATVTIHLHATRDQLEAVLGLLAPMAPNDGG